MRSWELRVRTPQGSALWLRVESFRRFIAASEAQHADWAAQHGLLREYTAWAVALDEVDRWSRAIQASSIAPQLDTDAVSMVYMASYLGSVTSHASTAPSSSGSGGFGGGFGGGGFSGVGGGAGGGGGGSW